MVRRVAVWFWLVLAAAVSAPGSSGAGTGSVFVIGGPGRLAGAGDRRLPRLRQGIESSISAYADVEEVDDPTWLAHEVETYVRRVATCTDVNVDWCRREVRPVGGAAVIFFATGSHAEVAWIAGGNRAVRLGWTRVVDTPSGTMTVDVPPADLMDALLAEWPSALAPFSFDAARDRFWAAAEIDRLVYYIDQVAAGLPGLELRQERWQAIDFVAGNLARIARLRRPGFDRPRDDRGEPLSSGGLPAALAEELEAVRAWRSGAGPASADGAATPWCALLPLSAPATPLGH